jgi:hypothetical protein
VALPERVRQPLDRHREWLLQLSERRDETEQADAKRDGESTVMSLTCSAPR